MRGRPSPDIVTRMTTRSFSAILCVLLAVGLAACSGAPERPNILWITSEDNGPALGAYGDEFADTPNLDTLAAKGMIYRNAWSTAPVCAPARTTIISGVYPPSLGAQHMRSMVKLPVHMRMYPQYLREIGYYATNNSKEDYNLAKPGQVWDDSSKTAHWRNRQADQPFFAIFNFTTTHESQIRKRPHTKVHDPAQVQLPAYHPDVPEIREDWAQYYDKMTEMDAQAGEILAQLAEDGLAEDTIVFYYGDHGPGIARSKRYPYNSGLRVPLIVYIPEKYRRLAPEGWSEGGETDRPVGFIDLAPTTLSLAGIQPPGYMQGQAFLGPYAEPEQPLIFGFRGRMDERYDFMRSVRDKRYIYIRNYNPHKIYGQYVQYLFVTPTTRVWHELYEDGKLQPPQTYFWETKPFEELYDLEQDPDETKNLIGAAEHEATAGRLRAALDAHLIETRDLGFLPEPELHARAVDGVPYAAGLDSGLYPIEEIKAVADLAASGREDVEAELVEAYGHDDGVVRYWSVMGFLIRGRASVARNRELLVEALGDDADCVRIAAAEALGRYGSDADSRRALDVLMSYADAGKNGAYLGMMAMNAIDYMDGRAASAKGAIAILPMEDPNADGRFNRNIGRIIEKTLADLE